MKHAKPRDIDWLLRAQLVVAVVAPWIIGRVVAPGLWFWAGAALVATLIFAALHRRDVRVWLIPASAAVSGVPAIPAWVAAIVGVVVLVIVLAAPIRAGSAQSPRLQWVAVAVLVVVAAGFGAWSVLSERSGDTDFSAAQASAAEAWDAPLVQQASDGATDSGSGADSGNGASGVEDTALEQRPQPLAKLRFARPGSDVVPVTSSSLFVEPGISEADLTRGPGHYPNTAKPGRDGNFAVAGHRTGWGSPFADLDELRPGDRVSVEDRDGQQFEYEVVRSAIVDPDEGWVIGDDPLEIGKPTLTLTTCDPPGINTKRLIVWATLVETA